MTEHVIGEPIEESRTRGPIGVAMEFLRTLRRMWRDPHYTFPRRLKLLTTFSVIYLLSPIDILPDFLPLLGFADDLTLLLGTFTMIVEEAKRYRQARRGGQ